MSLLRLAGRPLWLAAAWLALAAPGAASPPRTLFLMLDAVPYQVVQRLTDPERPGGPLLEAFGRPVPLVSSFPSSTSVAASGLYAPAGLERSPGYEARFFDWQHRRVRGGGPLSYFRIKFPWREFFDWTGKGAARSAVGALWPVRASVSRVRRAVDAFLASDKTEFHAYIEMTDTAAHLDGPDALEPVFEILDRTLTEARRDHAGELRVVLFSDHGIDGGEPLQNVRPAVREEMASAGWRERGRLRRPGDVVLTAYGLVSSFEAYTEPGAEGEVARRLAAVEGVDLCVWRSDAGWRVESERGSAEIRRQEGDGGLWRYRPRTGDPLRYQPVNEGLRQRLGGGEAGFPDEEWFRETAGHDYPDALYRIARAFELVVNPASTLCSVERGRMYGLGTTEFLARSTQGALRWTHGALERHASLGFLMTDDPGWRAPSAVRFDRTLTELLAGAGDTRGEPEMPSASPNG